VDPSTAKSRSGWVIFYAGCPVSWASKLQSQVALSTTEAEYIALSQALRDVIPVMNLLQEMRERKFQVICNEPYDTARYLRITLAHWNSLGFPSYVQEPSTTLMYMFAFIIFASMYEKDLSRYSLLTQKTRLLT
jgi:hypothetical protein